MLHIKPILSVWLLARWEGRVDAEKHSCTLKLCNCPYTLKIEKICFSPKVSIQPCWPKSDSALPGAISAQSGPKELHQKAIPAQGRAHAFQPWDQISSS